MGDYAVSIGTTGFDYPVQIGDAPPLPPNGVFQAVHGLRFADISDGLSNTLMVGEKHVPPTGVALPPWDCGIYDGHNPNCSTRAAGPGFAIATSVDDQGWKFGSRHPGICQFVFCDGSVRAVFKSIDSELLGWLAQRNDGQALGDY